MSKFQVGDRVDTGSWGIVTVKVTPDDKPFFYADYNYADGGFAGEGMFEDDNSTLVDSLVSRVVAAEREPVVPEFDNVQIAAQLDRIERLLRFEINRFYGVVMDEDGTFRRVGILPEYNNK